MLIRSVPNVILALASLLFLSPAAQAKVCVIWDPSDTSVNVRTTPNGKYQSTLMNGTQVEVVSYHSDQEGRAWASIVQRGSSGQSFVMASLTRDCIQGSLTPDGRIVR